MKPMACWGVTTLALATNVGLSFAQQPNAMVFWRLPLGGDNARDEKPQFGLTLGYSRPAIVVGAPSAAVRPPPLEFSFTSDGFNSLRLGSYNASGITNPDSTSVVRTTPRIPEPRLDTDVTLGGWWSRRAPPGTGPGLRPSEQGAETLTPAISADNP